MIPVILTQILITETGDSQIIVLKEKDGPRSFPIVIGILEAAAIDRHVKKIRTPRPLTHDLLDSVIKILGGRLERIIVTELRDKTFFAKLIIMRNGASVDVDSRPSDAVALAVLNDAPIFVEEKVLDEVCKWHPQFREGDEKESQEEED